MKLVQEIGRLTTASKEGRDGRKDKVLGYFSMNVGRISFGLFVLEKKFLELPSVVSEMSNALDTVGLVVLGTDSGVTRR